jgi:hypothetical protein
VTAELADRLARRLSQVCGGPVTIEGLGRLSGGAGRETWTFTAHSGETARALILRTGAGTGGSGAGRASRSSTSFSPWVWPHPNRPANPARRPPGPICTAARAPWSCSTRPTTS